MRLVPSILVLGTCFPHVNEVMIAKFSQPFCFHVDIAFNHLEDVQLP